MNRKALESIRGAQHLAKHRKTYFDRALNEPGLTDEQAAQLQDEMEAGALGDWADFTGAERRARQTIACVLLAESWATHGYPIATIDRATLEALGETDPPERLLDGTQTVGVECGEQFFLIRWLDGRCMLASPMDENMSDDQFDRITTNIAYVLQTRPEGLDIREHRPSPKAMRKQGRKYYPTVQYIIQAARDLHPQPTGETRGPRDEGWTQSVRTLVRGHWRRQPYGPGNSLTKVIWIRPFWRGPEDAPVSIHPVRITAERQQ